MSDCLFCKIADGKIPAKIIYQDDRVVAFEDIRPQAPTHALIVPREHFDSLNEIPEEKGDLLSSCLFAGRKIAALRGIDASGYRIVLNTARDSGQEVFHIHFHLLGGRRMTWPPG